MHLSKIFANTQGEETEDFYIETLTKYIDKGKLNLAFKIAEEAFTKYPDSEKIREKYEHIKKESIINECSHLEALIAEKPSPVAYAKLGSYYYETGNIAKAIEVCKQGLSLFPEYGRNNLVLGTLYYDQYQISLDSENALMAIQYLEKAIKHGIDNQKAYFDLINLYLDIGAFGRAKKKIYRYQDLFPDDAKMKPFLWQVNNIDCKEEDEEKIKELCNNHGQKEKGHESDQNDTNSNDVTHAFGNNFQNLIDNMRVFENTDWAAGILLIDENGFVLASKLLSAISEDLLGASLNRIFQTADQFTQKIYFGEFESCIIEGENSDIYIYSINKMLFCLIAQNKVKQGIVKAYIKNYLETS
ncbi:MAG: roadblock/LC7 domain-containing protein [bacterium]